MPFIGENISQSEYSNNCNDIICKALDCGFAKIQIGWFGRVFHWLSKEYEKK